MASIPVCVFSQNSQSVMILFDEYCNSMPSQFSQNLQFVILLFSQFEYRLPISAIPSSLHPQKLQLFMMLFEVNTAMPTGVSYMLQSSICVFDADIFIPVVQRPGPLFVMLRLFIVTWGAPTLIAYLFSSEMGFIIVLSLFSPISVIFLFMLIISLQVPIFTYIVESSGALFIASWMVV